MAHREKRILDLWLTFLLLFNVSSITGLVLIGNVWVVLFSIAVLAVDFYWYYVRRVKGKKPRYPLASPEGKADVYLPRTDIPRPVIADFREIEEKERKMAKIKKLQSEKTHRKKK